MLCGLAIWSIPEAGRQLGEPDHGQIVIDEWAGMWLAAFGISFYTDLTVWIGFAQDLLGFESLTSQNPVVLGVSEKFLGAWVF